MPDGTSTTATVAVFGMLDYLVLGGMTGLVFYWFVLRRKKGSDDIPVIKQLSNTPGPQRNMSYDPCFVSKMKNSGKNVIVFYGSQTGTAEDFATRLTKDSVRYGMKKGMAADPEEFDMDDLPKLPEIEKSLAIFCVATYGEGDPTDNAQELYDWLQDGNSSLEGLNYAVFGLGNKTYEHFNSMGRFVDKRLEELGATRVFELGEGDDDGNIEEDFVNWRENFWPAVCMHFGISEVGEDVSMRQFSVTVHKDIDQEKLFTGEPARLHSFAKQKPPFDVKNPYLAPVTVNRELHKGGDRSCMHIEVDISGSKIRYDAGDHLGVYPVNNSELVEAIGQRLGADLEEAFTLTNVDEDASKVHPFPCPTTYRTALNHYLDITSTPRSNLLKELLEYASDPADKDFLRKLTAPTPEGKELFNSWVLRDHRTLLVILDDLPSFRPPIDHLCELLPKLQPRYYSISSSHKMHPTTVHITAVLVEYTTPTGKLQKGVATSWLKLKQPAGEQRPKIPVFVRKSQFRLPFKPTVPVIMIGPGTGVAPFRGFIQDRHVLKTEGKPIGETVLYFGCRHKNEDFIYSDELDAYVSDSTLTHMHVAFSRDQPQKVYVQHLLKETAAQVWRLIDAGAHIYVCGDARHMAHDVDEVLLDTVVSEGKLDRAAAQDYLKRLRSRGRYSCDIWS